MQDTALMFILFLLMCVSALEDIYYPNNSTRTRTTVSGIAEYRSALTLDWLAAEDTRQRELALAFETEAAPSVQVIASDCIGYPKPASGKVGRLMLELLKNLEGDDGTLIPELIQALVRSKLLVETSMLEAEPDLESLVKTPGDMMGEPHATFPRILAMIWMTATDPSTVNKNGWCSISQVAKYLVMTSPPQIARHMRDMDPIIARARFVMEEFIQHVTPNMYDKKNLQLLRMRQTWIKSLGTTASVKTTTVTEFVLNDNKHVLVNNPLLDDDDKRNNSPELAQLSVCLLLCGSAAIAFSSIIIGL